jgi:hypothetical protein
MKRQVYYALIGLLAMTATACSDSGRGGTKDKTANYLAEASTPSADPAQLTTIQWIDSAKNLGRINEGQTLKVAFRFKNTGDKPLIIESVVPGCGCTVADYPKQPIAPGAEGEITGAFDSKGREGLQHKEIRVVANTKNTKDHTISFAVEVLKANP